MEGRGAHLYMRLDPHWKVQPCPHCHTRIATAHGWLFTEPPPPVRGLRPDTPDCDREWAEAIATCEAQWLNPDAVHVTGHYLDIMDCARGIVSPECGGNPTL